MNADRVKYRQVICFLKVAELRSFVRAAEALNTTQPAVSKTISELEEVLRVTLLERSRRGVVLTAAGELFRRHGTASLVALRQGVESLAKAQAGDSLRIAVGILPTVATSLMPLAIKRAKDGGLAATVYLVAASNDILLQMLKQRQLDLVVGRFSDITLMRDLVFEHLYSEQIVIVVREGHPLLRAGRIELEAIRAYTVLLPEQGSIIRPMVDTLLMSRGVADLPDVIETTSPTFGRAYLKISDAIWIISQGVVSDDLGSSSLAVLDIDVDVGAGPVGLTLRADMAPSLGIESIRQALRAVVNESKGLM